MNIDVVAEAMCNAAAGGYGDFTWDEIIKEWGADCFRCNWYRKMAEAAIEALGLTEEYRVSHEGWHRNLSGEKFPHTSHIETTDLLHAHVLADGWDLAYIESHFVSPWVRSE